MADPAAERYFLLVSGRRLMVSAWLWEQLEGPKPDKDFPSDGCSWSPDNWLTLRRTYKLWPACHIHDFHYRCGPLGGTWEARRQADIIFRRNLHRLLRAQGSGRFRARRLSWMYWGRVRVWGASSYQHWAEGAEPQGKLRRLREAWSPLIRH